MTLSEVEAVIGAPAGDYYAGQVANGEGVVWCEDYTGGVEPAVTKEWVSNDTVLELGFDRDGRLRKKLIAPMERDDPSIFDLLWARLRARFSW